MDAKHESLSAQSAADLINQGSVVSFPTETVYGLGADATNEAAVREIYKLKGRPLNNPIIIHTNSVERLSECAALEDRCTAGELSARIESLSKLWPGPLSIVFEKNPAIVANVTNGSNLVGVRIPAHSLALEFLALCKNPVAAPSANKSNRVSPTSASHVREEFGSDIGVLDGGNCGVGLESTVVEPRENGVIIHRPGFVTAEQIDSLAGPLIPKEILSNAERGVSPGQLTKHYAPTTPCYTLSELPSGLNRVAVVGLSDEIKRIAHQFPESWRAISFPDTTAYAAQIYRTLREIDRSGAIEAIAVIPPPPVGLGLAICDRLSRATQR